MDYGRKISGGKYHKQKKKRLFEKDSQARIVKLGKEKKKPVKVRSGFKTAMIFGEFANVTNPETHKSKKSKIKNVIETPSNKFLARQNILTKGAVIETELGKARITNRPSREGSIHAILIK